MKTVQCFPVVFRIKKMSLIMFTALLICAVKRPVFSEENEVIYSNQWYLPNEFIARIAFREDRYYVVFSVGGWGPGGDYLIKNNEVTLYYPDLDPPLWDNGRKTLEWLIPDGISASYNYDSEYIDFDCIGCLRNGEKILRNLSNDSPSGREYTLDGEKVIKRSGFMVTMDNLRIRERPSVDSKNLVLHIYDSFYNREYDTRIVPKNTRVKFDAVTVKQDTIDGITAPWYRIIIILNEIYHANVWIFGGYLKDEAP